MVNLIKNQVQRNNLLIIINNNTTFSIKPLFHRSLMNSVEIIIRPTIIIAMYSYEKVSEGAKKKP